MIGKKYNETCSTSLSCYNNLVCVSGRCECESPSEQYHDPIDNSCKPSKQFYGVMLWKFFFFLSLPLHTYCRPWYFHQKMLLQRFIYLAYCVYIMKRHYALFLSFLIIPCVQLAMIKITYLKKKYKSTTMRNNSPYQN